MVNEEVEGFEEWDADFLKQLIQVEELGLSSPSSATAAPAAAASPKPSQSLLLHHRHDSPPAPPPPLPSHRNPIFHSHYHFCRHPLSPSRTFSEVCPFFFFSRASNAVDFLLDPTIKTSRFSDCRFFVTGGVAEVKRQRLRDSAIEGRV